MRLLVVSNRLPVTVSIKGGSMEFKESVGGLVTGISSYLDSLKKSSFSKAEYVWVGWPGIAVPDRLKGELKEKALNEHNAYPVYISEKVMDKFYLGFCNKLIWPLFHYFPSYATYSEDLWENYKRVNETFFDALMEIIQPNDVVWVQDYHLMLLPKLIRERMPNAPIGFFLHIPFPSSEIFQLIPSDWRAEILEGLMGSDLVGFHTHDYTRHFLSCLLRILGLKHNMGEVIVDNRVVKADTFPMGVDFKRFNDAITVGGVQKEKIELKKTFRNFKTVLSVDRLDYSKGLVNRLQGYEVFLEQNPDWREKVVLVAVVVPSRVGVERYQQMKRQIDELVGKINGKFGTVNWTPIIYQYRFVSFEPLVALYSVSDVALVTPLRDGMNLVAKEYIASRSDKTGVLILSEMAGAAKELGEAIIINPNNRQEIADAIKRALEMPVEEQLHRNEVMQTRIKRYDVVKWAEEFMNELFEVRKEQEHMAANLLDKEAREELVLKFKKAKHRILLLDYDGSLVPFAKHPQLAKPPQELLVLLRELSEDPKTQVIIISGRDKETLGQWFASVPVALVAEHGAWIKEQGENDWKMLKPLSKDWKDQVHPLMEVYSDRLPGSFVEDKDYSVAWHYRKADPEQASLRAKELLDNLMELTRSINVQVLQGNKVIEVRCAGVDKGNASLNWVSRNKPDFIMGIGDDHTDEDMFRSLPKRAYSIKVGLGSTYAKYSLHSYAEVRKLLEDFADSAVSRKN
ncbi:MAG: bifunctional alpha,alpha-trehalose-phosphate synthase (UDP-forming)/trehalose-phosphatase [Armatimonadota bacterium]